MFQILQVFCVIFSGLLVALSIPNDFLEFGSPLISLISLVPFYIACINAKKAQCTVLYFALLTFTTHLVSSYWLAFFKDFAIFTLGASALGTAAIGAGFGLLFFIPFSKKSKASFLLENNSPHSAFRLVFRVCWFTMIYVLYEWFKSLGFLGYPWGTLSMAFYKWNTLIQIADITGTYGITFLAVLFSALIGEGIMLLRNEFPDQGKRCFSALKSVFLLTVTLFVLSEIYGIYRKSTIGKPVKQINAIMVQQNSDPWKNSCDMEPILVSERLTDEAFLKAGSLKEHVDLVVWSEGCLDATLPRDIETYENYPEEKPLLKFIKEKKVPFLLGSRFKRNIPSKKTMNGAAVIDENGKFRGAYPKNHLVPFAESLPFTEIPAIRNFLSKSIGISAGWAPGDQYTFFNIKASYPDDYVPEVKVYDLNKQAYEEEKEERNSLVQISTPICYDDAFPDICRPLMQYGSEVFMNITDDSWSQKKSSEIQHFVVASYRAIEYRTTLARSTNSGYSVVIDPCGRIIDDMPLFEEASMFTKIPVYERKQTFYLVFGNWIPWLFAILCLIYGLFMIFTRKNAIFENSERKKLSKWQKKYTEKNDFCLF